jgi:hypothetical protein
VAGDLEIIEPTPAVEPQPGSLMVEGIDISRLSPDKLREVLRRLGARSQSDPHTVRDRVLLTRRVERLERENDTLRRQLVISAADMAALSLGPSEPDYSGVVDFADDYDEGE